MTEIVLIAITVMVTAVDVVTAGCRGRHGDVIVLQTTILSMTAMTVTSPVVAARQKVTV